MKKDIRVVVAKKKLVDGKVLQGQVVSNRFRRPQFAIHALPSILSQRRDLKLHEVAIFRDGQVVPEEELVQASARL
jgi:hypothetical protein